MQDLKYPYPLKMKLGVCADLPWPAAPEEVAPCSGYSIVACLLPEAATPDDFDVIGSTQSVPVAGWSIKKGELFAVVYADFELPAHGRHVRGYVYPDGTVLTLAGLRLKSMEWWPTFVRTAMRAVDTDQDDLSALPEEALAA